MSQQIQDIVASFRDSGGAGEMSAALRMTAYLLAGGLAAIYIRFLYRKCSASVSDTDSITRVFPLLLMVTTAVIAVVKSSLALSLGLVGALSIVRFRAAIKDPEELVYLFLCIAVGLSLGAEQPFLAIGLVFAATLFVVAMHRAERIQRDLKLMLTIRGDASRFVTADGNVGAVLDSAVPQYTLHRLDIEGGHGQMRIALPRMTSPQTTELIATLHQQLPDCEISYVNLNSAV